MQLFIGIALGIVIGLFMPTEYQQWVKDEVAGLAEHVIDRAEETRSDSEVGSVIKSGEEAGQILKDLKKKVSDATSQKTEKVIEDVLNS